MKMDKEKLRVVLEKVALGTISSKDAAIELGLKNSRFHELKRAAGIVRPLGKARAAKQRADFHRAERAKVSQLVADGLMGVREAVDHLKVTEATLRRWVKKAKKETSSESAQSTT